MTSTANQTAGSMPSPKVMFLGSFESEHATTLKVLRAYPVDKQDLQPHPRCKSAKDLAWVFVGEMGMGLTAITTGFDWSNPPKMPPAPATLPEVIAAFDDMHKKLVAAINAMPDEKFSETVQFPSGPGKMGEFPKIDFLWFLMCDQIHHRGQFSIYLRMADAKVPSIYGPTADEPWF